MLTATFAVLIVAALPGARLLLLIASNNLPAALDFRRTSALGTRLAHHHERRRYDLGVERVALEIAFRFAPPARAGN